MTDIEIDVSRKKLYDEARQVLKEQGDPNYEDIIGKNKFLPDDFRKKYEHELDKLNLIEMIHSILTYESRKNWTKETVLNDRYMNEYEKDFSNEEFEKIIQDEVDFYKKNAIVEKDTYTDDEGLTYNSVIFKPDVERECNTYSSIVDSTNNLIKSLNDLKSKEINITMYKNLDYESLQDILKDKVLSVAIVNGNYAQKKLDIINQDLEKEEQNESEEDEL